MELKSHLFINTYPQGTEYGSKRLIDWNIFLNKGVTNEFGGARWLKLIRMREEWPGLKRWSWRNEQLHLAA